MTVDVKQMQRPYIERLLGELRDLLEPRGITTVLVIDKAGRPALEVVDCRFRTRRVFVHLGFRWLYWGDQPDERVSFFDLEAAADRVEEAARKGWREGEQGDLSVDLGAIARAYRA